MLKVFDKEENYFVWKQVLATLSTITEAWAFEDKAIIDSLKTFKIDLIIKCAKSKGWHLVKDDDTVVQMHKARIFANSSTELEVQRAAKRIFDAFLAGNDGAIKINIRVAVFQIALEHGGVSESDAMLKVLKSASSVDKRDACIKAFGCSEDPALIARTLKLALSEEMITQNDTMARLQSLTKHKPGKEALWK